MEKGGVERLEVDVAVGEEGDEPRKGEEEVDDGARGQLLREPRGGAVGELERGGGGVGGEAQAHVREVQARVEQQHERPGGGAGHGAEGGEGGEGGQREQGGEAGQRQRAAPHGEQRGRGRGRVPREGAEVEGRRRGGGV